MDSVGTCAGASKIAVAQWPLQLRYGTVIEEVSSDILFGTCGSSCADVTDVSSPGCSQVFFSLRKWFVLLVSPFVVPFLPVCPWIFDSASKRGWLSKIFLLDNPL